MADDAGGAPPPAPAGPPIVAPGPDISIASRFVGVSVPLYLIAIAALVLRLAHRLRTSSVSADVFVILALIAVSFQTGLLYAAIPHGFGRHNFYLSIDDQIEGMRLMHMSYLPWGCGVAFGKISMTRLLMRFKTTSFWTVIFWSIIAMQFLCALTIIIVCLASCRPIEASWNPMVPGASCWDPIVFQASIYTMGANAIATDIIFAAISTALIINLRRPRCERIIIIILMNIGVFSSSATIVKLNHVEKLQVGKIRDQLFNNINLATWSVAEILLGIIADCIPVLKSTFERFLRRVGLLTSTRTSTRRIGGASSGRINTDRDSFEVHLSNLRDKSDIDVTGTPSEQCILEPIGPGGAAC